MVVGGDPSGRGRGEKPQALKPCQRGEPCPKESLPARLAPPSQPTRNVGGSPARGWWGSLHHAPACLHGAKVVVVKSRAERWTGVPLT